MRLPELTGRTGLTANAIILLVCVCVGYFQAASLDRGDEVLPMPSSVIIGALIFCAIAIFCVVAVKVTPAGRKMARPSLFRASFFPEFPLQAFFMGSLAIAFFGFGMLIASASLSVESEWRLLVCTGVGGLLGVAMAVRIVGAGAVD